MHLTRTIVLVSAALTLTCAPPHQVTSREVAPLVYTIDVTDQTDDRFTVSLRVDDLTEANAVFQFAATAPGTYQTMNIGRFVSDFTALDEAGEIVASEQLDTNRWRMHEPERVTEIRYRIADTWDTTLEGGNVYPMAGTSLEADHAQICPHATLGFPIGMQERPIRLDLVYPDTWIVGTALPREDEDTWLADNYDHAVDSPILLGELSKASTTIDEMIVDIYTYSKTGKVSASALLESKQELLPAFSAYIGEMPVERYTFLYHFEDFSMGAWEHNLSSNYVYSERDWSPRLESQLVAVAAHELFHIVTPLHIHSDIITPFDFADPNPSAHLWLYEGVTEWAAHMLRLRGGMITLEEYLDLTGTKLIQNGFFDASFSLVDISKKSYQPGGSRQFVNIYMRGAVVAGLLDIELLRLSDGEQGLRELLLELLDRYGRNQPFPEDRFFDILVEMTHPSIRGFITAYIEGTEPLPIAESYALLGIDYQAMIEGRPSLGVEIVAGAEGGYVIAEPMQDARAAGIEAGEPVIALNGTPLSGDIAAMLARFAPGDAVRLTLAGEAGARDVTLVVGRDETRYHVLTARETLTPEQRSLRAAWLGLR